MPIIASKLPVAPETSFGKSETVAIEDRGPYVKGRVIDVSPKTADKLGMKKDGVAPVEVKPLTIPKTDDGTKPDQPPK